MVKDKTQPEAIDDEALDDAQGGLLLPAIQIANAGDRSTDSGSFINGDDGAAKDAPPVREQVAFTYRKI